MSDEIMVAIQVIRLCYDGINIGFNITGATLREAKNLVMFMIGLLNHEKLQGKTSLKNMLKKDGNLQIVQLKEEDVKQFEKLAKKYGILYSKMPDINRKDGMKEYLFPVEATPRINALLVKLGTGKIEDISDYIRNGEGSFEETLEYLKKHNFIPKEATDITPERAEQLMEMSKNIRYNEIINDVNKVDITISKDLVHRENDETFITRVPGTYGEDVRYLISKKDDVMLINQGKTLLTFLEKDKEYELLDKDFKPVAKVKGEELSTSNYSRVADDLREKSLEKALKEKTKNIEKSIEKGIAEMSQPKQRG